uniref:LLGL domain-containing protein n=1 Tax=Macrostomum lignano TaxID=282301 RepID=A0A1I8HU96_9PLAT
MKKIKNMKGVLDGLRGLGGSSQSKSETESFDFEENLKSEDFKIAKIVCHGFPNAPCCIAFDPIQKLLAIGTKHGSIRILGQSGVDCNLSLDKEAIKQLIFIINEGGLISIASNNTISLWTIRQKEPTITMQMQFTKREDISHAYLPFQSKFIYIGTNQGNVYLLNIESFKVSGYDIKWNKAIGMRDSNHPGAVIHLSECPSDQSKLLIGFRKGLTVLWDLHKRDAVRFRHTEDLCSVAWHWEGRAFACSHIDGSLLKWTVKTPQKPTEHFFPRADLTEGDSAAAAASFRPISRVSWLSRKQDKAELLLFTGGGPQELPQPCLNIQAGRHIDVLMMEHAIIDIVPLCESPFVNDSSEAYAVAVLQQNDLTVIDLLSDG